MAICSRCHANTTRSSQKYCRECHAEYMRMWRPGHPLSPEQQRRSNCRSYAHVYRRRGLIPKLPCQICTSANSQMHHPDYDQPLLIVWLCRACHLAIHKTLDFDVGKNIQSFAELADKYA